MNELLGKRVKYEDYLGVIQYGRIVQVYPNKQDHELLNLAIQNEDKFYNRNNIQDPNGNWIAIDGIYKSDKCTLLS